MKYCLLIVLIIFTVTMWPPNPSRRGETAGNPQSGAGTRIYSDPDCDVYADGRVITVRDSSTGRAGLITLPPPRYSRPTPGSGDTRPRIKREGGHLRVTLDRTVYRVRLKPRPAVLAVYPDPGCGGDMIIVDKHRNLLFLYKKGRLEKVYSVSTGKKPEYTPEGKFKIINKVELPPNSGNPRLGPRWLGIGVPAEKDLRSPEPDPRAPVGIKYGLHGTDEPESIGTYASGGCIRLDNRSIVEIYDLVEVGTPVEIIR